MDNFGCLYSSLSLFLFCNELAKKYDVPRLAAKPSTSPSIRTSTSLAGPPLPLPSVRTLIDDT